MGYYCTVPQCTSLAGKTKNVKFHRFPRDTVIADEWNRILKRGKPYTKYSKVCSLHFTPADYNVTTMGQWKTLKKDAVPSQNLPKLNPDGSVMVIRKSRTIKYREGKKEDYHGDKSDKWSLNIPSHAPISACNTPDVHMACANSLGYPYSHMNQLPNSPLPNSPLPLPHTPHPSISSHLTHTTKPKKQDAIMQTDPVQSEDDDSQPNNSYSEVSDKSYEVDYGQYHKQEQNYEAKDYTKQSEYSQSDYPKEEYKEVNYKQGEYKADNYTKHNDSTKQSDYTKPPEYTPSKDYAKDDFIPQTNEEYNKEAEKYALERKSLNGYDKPIDSYSKVAESFPKSTESYQKMPEIYSSFEKSYQSQRTDLYYQNGYADSVELLRSQQHNLQLLQEQHRITENQNFFNENHIKQEIDINIEDDKFMYNRSKEQLDANSMYNNRRLIEQQRLLEQMQHQVKQEPDTNNGCDSVLQPAGSPYYPPANHSNVSGGYYEQLARPGPELLIAKQNALAAHTQLWQNTMKRPFFYSENPHYNSSQLLHRYEDLQRILQ